MCESGPPAPPCPKLKPDPERANAKARLINAHSIHSACRTLSLQLWTRGKGVRRRIVTFSEMGDYLADTGAKIYSENWALGDM